MLDVMRSNARHTLIAVIFAVIIAAFVLQFGRGSSGFRARVPETWAAKVNGKLVTATEFSSAYSNRLKQMNEQRGGKYTSENAQQDNLRQETLKALVDQELIAQQAPVLGIAVGDGELADAIFKQPQFQQNGAFDEAYYTKVVENWYGMSKARFEEAYRRDLLRAKVMQAVLSGAVVSDDEIKAHWLAQNESAAIAYVKLTGFQFRDKAAATDAEAEAWAKDHAKEIEEAYAKDKATRWTQAAATKVRAITVPLTSSASPDEEKAARARIDAAYAEVKGGKSFEDVAKEKSEDSLTKMSGGDLGYVAKGASAYGKTLEEEAEKLKAGELSGVFKDRTGFHFLKAEEKRAAKEQPLAEVQKQIASDLLRGQKSRELAKAKAQETLQQLKEGKELAELFPPKKESAPGQFDFSSFLTPQSAEAKEFHPLGGYVPGVGQAPKLSAAVFALTKAGDVPAAPVEEEQTLYVFKVTERKRADPSKFDDAAKKSTREQLENQKKQELYTAWIEGLRKQAEVKENAAILSYDLGSSSENFNPDD
jgi:peptidyl-prolyl cis-trans isomerase D